MSRRNQRTSKYDSVEMEDLIINSIKNVFAVLLIIGLLYAGGWMYFVAYNPEKQRFIKRANAAYNIIQEEVLKFYNVHEYVWNEDQRGIDPICSEIAKKHSKLGGNCVIKQGILSKNFTISKLKTDIYGLERPAVAEEGTLVKDIMIDVDGEKGPNELGRDQVIIKIYSKGLLGGKLIPANCKMLDFLDYGIPRSYLCAPGVEINFMETNVPFGYDVTQFREDKPPKEQFRRITRNVPFLRADCAALGGEYFGGSDYCDKRGYAWIRSCSNDYECKMELSKK